MLAQFARTEVTTVSEQASSLHHAVDKIGPPDGDDRYGNPLSKYGLMRWAYGPTHYGMELMTTTLTFKANQANEGHVLGAWDRGHRLHDQQDN
jgi:hypothetical protein